MGVLTKRVREKNKGLHGRSRGCPTSTTRTSKIEKSSSWFPPVKYLWNLFLQESIRKKNKYPWKNHVQMKARTGGHTWGIYHNKDTLNIHIGLVSRLCPKSASTTPSWRAGERRISEKRVHFFSWAPRPVRISPQNHCIVRCIVHGHVYIHTPTVCCYGFVKYASRRIWFVFKK